MAKQQWYARILYYQVRKLAFKKSAKKENTMPGWEELGMQTASNVANGVLGLALGGINDRRQLKQQEKLQNLQITGSKQLTDYNFQKQMEMWKNTNYPAQMAMLKQAGLNPALIYDNGGGGATTSLATGNVSGADAPKGGQEAVQMMGLALQRQMQAAQIELTKAQTQKTIAETGAVQPGIEKTQTETASIAQGVQNQKAQQRLTEIQSDIAAVDSEIKGKTQNMVIASVATALRTATAEMNIAERNNEIDAATKNTKINQIKQNLANSVIEWWKSKAEITNISQATKESVNRVQMAIQANMRDWDKLSLESGKVNQELYDAMNTSDFPKELTDILEAIGFGAAIKKGAGTIANPKQ